MPSDPPPAPGGTTAPGHYFDASPATTSAPRQIELTLPDLTVSLVTDRGVFSGERVDPGTKYLLLEAPAPATETAHALDLGCGYGPIALTLAHRCPGAQVWAVDVNERAVALTGVNATATGVGDRVHASVVGDDRPFGAVPDDVTFDVIWSNPPIRIGKAALHRMLERWLPRLRPGGQAVVVVQKHLGSDSLQRWLQDQGWSAERIGSRAGYRLLRIGPGDPE